MNKDTRERFTLRIPTRLFQELQKEANEAGVSTNAYVLQILWMWAEKKEERVGQKVEYFHIFFFSILVSWITSKIIAVHYFKIIDSYIEDIIQQLTEAMEESKRQ